jgi:vancomycin permeability regulator SanA
MKKLKLISLLLFSIALYNRYFLLHPVNQTSNKYLYHKTTHIPHNKVALLLGTSKKFV